LTNLPKGKWPRNVKEIGAKGVREHRYRDGPVPLKANISAQRWYAFAVEYARNPDAQAAAVSVGYSARYGKILLKKHEVQVEIRKLFTQGAKRTEVDVERVVLELARVALSSIADAVEWDADGITRKASSELSPDVLAAISEVSEVRSKDGPTLRLKMHDKMAALTTLAKYLGMYADTGQDGGQVSAEVEGLRRKYTLVELREMRATLVEVQETQKALGDGGEQ
jgi:phage terminase small subunit